MTRQLARRLERDAEWRPNPEVYDEGSGLELWTNGPIGLVLGYDAFTVDIGQADGNFYAVIVRWFMSRDAGWDIADEIQLGPFHSIDRAKRQAILWLAREESIEKAEVEKVEKWLAEQT